MEKIYAEETAEDCSDFSGLTESSHDNLGDKGWAKTVYEKSEEMAT